MDKEKLKAYGVDYENAVKRFAGNEALYEKFLKKLTEDDHLAIGEQAMKEERYEDVLEAVHALKGVAGTLGMTELFQAAIRGSSFQYVKMKSAICRSRWLRYIQNLKKPVRRFPEQIAALPACVRSVRLAHTLFLYRKFLKSSEIVYNRLEIKNDITKERRGLRHDVVYEVFVLV